MIMEHESCDEGTWSCDEGTCSCIHVAAETFGNEFFQTRLVN